MNEDLKISNLNLNLEVCESLDSFPYFEGLGWAYWERPDYKMKWNPEPDELWILFKRYMRWLNNNPIIMYERVGKAASLEKTPKLNLPIEKGFSAFCGVTHGWYLGLKSKYQYKETVELIKDIIEQQQLGAGLAGQANPALVARLVGLIERKQIEHTEEKRVVLYLPDNGRKVLSEEEKRELEESYLESESEEEEVI